MAAKGARAAAGKTSKKGASASALAAKTKAKGKSAAPKAKASAKTPPPKVAPAKKAAAATKKVAAPKAVPPKKGAAPKAAEKAAPAKHVAAPKAEKKPVPKAEKKAAPKAEKKAPPKAEKKAPPKKAPLAAEPKADAEPSNGLAVGESVPDVELVDHDGKAFSLGSLRGESYVLYFYPKDDTPGCTREACAFRDDLGKFDGAKVRIIGISPDKPESHVRFRDKYGLPFTLLSDVEKAAANAFGVWVKKQNYGREYMGIQRSTFLVDESGKVKKVWRNVKVDGHSQAVLDAAS